MYIVFKDLRTHKPVFDFICYTREIHKFCSSEMIQPLLSDNLGNACLTSFFVTGAWDHAKLLQSLKAYQNAVSAQTVPKDQFIVDKQFMVIGLSLYVRETIYLLISSNF